ncbi:hypothetical protein MRB53_003577 [Persea americana]|uniref:Uncharacterized protein n=1 Tax=Persea americana TaxID=3435 RepID=A0ACC2MXW7_PERAE|nr:hypothetical protein MRB53_003577 [Persea americana]
MAAVVNEIRDTPEKNGGEGSVEAYKESEIEMPDVHNVGEKMRQASDAYKHFAGIEAQPLKMEIILWYIYGLCSYFIHTVLLPIVFPLIISQMVSLPPPPEQGWTQSSKGMYCRGQELQLYEALVHGSITVNNLKFSPLVWVSISWAAGIFLCSPILAGLAFQLDHGHNQSLIAGAATIIGALFCLPTGFFKSVWLFVLYTAFIVAASTVAAAVHTRHLGLMIRGFTGPTVIRQHFSRRCSIASWLSLYGTAVGTVGAAIIAAFTYHMLHHKEKLVSLWVVSIFSGLKWMVGASHAFTGNRPGPNPEKEVARWGHAFAIFKYPHAAGSAVGILFSSFGASCIFTGGVLYVAGELCIKPVLVLFLWLAYFFFPLFSLPLLHPLQLLIRADALRMMFFGSLISALTSGAGFFFRRSNWPKSYLILAAVFQGTAACVLHAFGRVLMLDCSPPGREGSFSIWFVWVKAIGTCAGFTVASAYAGNVGRSFGIAFLSIVAGVVLMIFGNISNLGGAVAAGHVTEAASEKGSPAQGWDNSSEWRGSVHAVVKEDGRASHV